MVIGVAGPYSAPSAEERQRNLHMLNEAVARLLELGHIPLIGVNAALPVMERARDIDYYQASMAISLAVIDRCEALLFLAESPGANVELDLVLSKGLPVFRSIHEVPAANDVASF